MGDPTRTPVTVPKVSDDAPRDAALAVCARARDQADAILLLDACGLLAPGVLTRRPRKPRRRRKAGAA